MSFPYLFDDDEDEECKMNHYKMVIGEEHMIQLEEINLNEFQLS